jgi:hypothetical protein
VIDSGAGFTADEFTEPITGPTMIFVENIPFVRQSLTDVVIEEEGVHEPAEDFDSY